MATDQGTGGYLYGRGQAKAHGKGRTEGLYRNTTGTADMYVVRTKVINRLRVGEGEYVETFGQVTLLLDKAQVLARDRSQFDFYLPTPPTTAPDSTTTPAVPDAAAAGVGRRAPQSLQDGRLWGGVWPETIGTGDPVDGLHARLSDAARELGGADLQDQVLSVLTGLSVRLPELSDGGKTYPVTAGGHKYELTLTAAPVGGPRHVAGGDKPADVLKMYGRANDSSVEKRRELSTQTAVASWGKGLSKSLYVVWSGLFSHTRADKHQDLVGFNLLSMDGERPTGVAKFEQDIEFTFTLRRVPGRLNLPGRVRNWRRPEDPRWYRTGRAQQTRIGEVPLDGSLRPGIKTLTWAGTPTGLPEDVIIHGVHGLAGIDRVARGVGRRCGGASWHPGPRC